MDAKNIYNDIDFMSIAKNILSNKEFKKMKKIIHHGTTRYDHSLKVAYLSYKLSKIVGGDTKSIIEAGILHDFFLDKYNKNIIDETKMFLKHPSIAKQNAINCFGINEKEGNIIEAHMFPLSITIPKYKEAWIVSIADKVVTIKEKAEKLTLGLGI